MVVDWKSDANLEVKTLDQRRAHVRGYVDMTGTERGLIVLMNTGIVIAVLASSQTVAA